MAPTSSSEKRCSKELGPGVGPSGWYGGPAPGPFSWSQSSFILKAEHLVRWSVGVTWGLVRWRGVPSGRALTPRALVNVAGRKVPRLGRKTVSYWQPSLSSCLSCRFEIDDSSPSMSGCCGEDCSYEILSRRTKFGDSQHSHAGGHCGGCCH